MTSPCGRKRKSTWRSMAAALSFGSGIWRHDKDFREHQYRRAYKNADVMSIAIKSRRMLVPSKERDWLPTATAAYSIPSRLWAELIDQCRSDFDVISMTSMPNDVLYDARLIELLAGSFLRQGFSSSVSRSDRLEKKDAIWAQSIEK